MQCIRTKLFGLQCIDFYAGNNCKLCAQYARHLSTITCTSNSSTSHCQRIDCNKIRQVFPHRTSVAPKHFRTAGKVSARTYSTFTNSGLLKNKTHHFTCLPKRNVKTKKNIYERKPKQTNDDVEEMPVFQYVGEKSRRAQRLYVWGFSFTGALGIPTFVKTKGTRKPPRRYQHTPYRLDLDEKILDISCGYGFTLLASGQKDTRKVFGTGLNTDSQLGLQEMSGVPGRNLDYVIRPTTISLPLRKPLSTRVSQVACGRAHSLVLTDEEGVFSFGSNVHGQCGRPVIETEVYQANPTMHRLKQFGNSVAQIACGHDHSLFLTENGEVYSCGWGADGQTGLGHCNRSSEPSKLEGDLKGEKIAYITSFADCSLALSDNGDVFGWGNSEYNQLALVTENSKVNTPSHLPLNVGKVVDIATGGSICAVVNDDGEVFVWGFGVLGKGPNCRESKTPEKIPPSLFGKSRYHQDIKVTKIKCGLHHFAAINSLGELFTWGRNDTGCLGLGHLKDQFFPMKVHVPGEVTRVACGVDHTVVIARTYI